MQKDGCPNKNGTLMNSKIKNLITAVTNFDRNAEALAIQVTRSEKPRIVQLNRDQLEQRGIRSDSTSITPKYAPSTIRRKRKLGQITRHVTLKDKEDFYGSFSIAYDKDSFEIISEDDKARYLINRYGAAILGLTPQNIGNLSQIIKPAFITMFFKTILT